MINRIRKIKAYILDYNYKSKQKAKEREAIQKIPASQKSLSPENALIEATGDIILSKTIVSNVKFESFKILI